MLSQSSIEARLQRRLDDYAYSLIPKDYVIYLSAAEWQEVLNLYGQRGEGIPKTPVMGGIPIRPDTERPKDNGE